MPKIDPVTGCTVQTLGEFWAGEAKREGKGREPFELQEEFFDEMEKERLAEENRYKDHMVSFETILKAAKDWNEGDPDDGGVPLPTKVLQVEEVHVGQTFRSSTLKLVVRCETERGVGRFTLETFSDSGTRLDPPDYDEEVTFEPIGREAL